MTTNIIRQPQYRAVSPRWTNQNTLNVAQVADAWDGRLDGSSGKATWTTTAAGYIYPQAAPEYGATNSSIMFRAPSGDDILRLRTRLKADIAGRYARITWNFYTATGSANGSITPVNVPMSNLPAGTIIETSLPASSVPAGTTGVLPLIYMKSDASGASPTAGAFFLFSQTMMTKNEPLPDEFFYGSTPDSPAFSYFWSGEADQSFSVRQAVVAPITVEGEVELADYQFQLDDGVAFGIGRDIALDENGFQPAGPAATVSEHANGAGDSVYFGRDRFEGGGTWGFGLHTDQTWTPEDAIDAKNALARAWRNPAKREAGAVSSLRYRVAGRTRRVFGRARNFAAPPDNKILTGLIPIACDFKPVDPYTYGDELRSRSITMVAAETGGFTFPLTFPISTLAGSVRQGVLNAGDVGGEESTPFEVIIRGPVVNPWIGTDDWKIEILGTVAYDQTVKISTYPWSMGAVRSDGVNMNLSPKTRLSKGLLDPSGTELSFGGTDSTGTARADITWRPRFVDW